MIDDIEQNAHDPMASRRKGLNIVWLIPLTALLIGTWIAWKSWSEQGPTITISFQDGEGLEEGKSKIRYRNIELGTVRQMQLSEDNQRVIVTAEMKPEAEKFLYSDTKFWVVRPRIGINQISGLQTLLSGGYIAVDFGAKSNTSEEMREFTGLENPPEVTIDAAGRRFQLYADQRGSVSSGSPVYYRNIEAGLVTNVKLDQEKRLVMFQLFIREPFVNLVTENSIFWNAGGLNLQLNANGIEFNMESLESLASGGIAFDLPKGEDPGKAAAEQQLFHLYATETLAQRQRAYESTRFTLYFSDSVRGLSVGAPVEFSGIPVGEVVNIDAEYNPDTLDIRIPVTIELERGRFRPSGAKEDVSIDQVDTLNKLIDKGLRATLKSGNLLTGAQFVDLVVMEDAKKAPALTGFKHPYPIIPTVSSGFNLLQQRINAVFTRLDALPIEKIGKNLDKSLEELQKALQTLNTVLKPFGERAKPISALVESTLKRTNKAMGSVDKTVAPNSQLQTQALKTLGDFSSASKAIRDLARFLERNPQSILLGKPSK